MFTVCYKVCSGTDVLPFLYPKNVFLLQSLGQVGRVVKVFPTGDVRVVVNSRTWTYNPRCLSHAPLKEIAEDECA